MKLRFKILSLLTLSLVLTSCSNASTAVENVFSDPTNNIGDWVQYTGTEDGAVIFETGYTESDGANAKMEEMWGKSEYYRFQVGCFPAEKKSIRLRGEFALQPAVADNNAAYSTGVFGDASDLLISIGTSKSDPNIKKLMGGPDSNSPFSIIYFTPDKYGKTSEFSDILLSGQIDLTTQGKTLHFAWPVDSGTRVIEALVAAGCKL